jgi:hypothetical protein
MSRKGRTNGVVSLRSLLEHRVLSRALPVPCLKRLRVLREHWGGYAWDNISKSMNEKPLRDSDEFTHN